MQLSTNYGLKLPEGTDNVRRQDFVDNFVSIDSVMKSHDTQLSDLTYQTAGGTATAITLTIKGTLVTGYPITFIASANNSGAATTINSKKLYKPGTTTAPNLIAGKAYTVWYNSSGDSGNGCFFIKASAEGTVGVGQVLAGYTFSNDSDTGLSGTIPSKSAATYTPTTSDQTIAANQYLSGAQTVKGDVNLVTGNIKSGVSIFGVAGKSSVVDTSDALATAAQILSGVTAYVNGSKITGTIASKGAATYTPGTTAQTIASGQYLSGTQTISGDANLLAANIVSGISIFGVAGAATIESLGGRKIATGSVTSGVGQNFTLISGTTTALNVVSVSGLGFTPSFIIVYGNYGSNAYCCIYCKNSIDSLYSGPTMKAFVANNNIDTNTAVYNCKGDVAPCSVTSGAFTVAVPGASVPCNWIAIE